MSEAPLVIEIFPMTSEGVIADFHRDVAYWDILVRPDGGDPIAEFEGLTLEEAGAKTTELQAQYPFAEVNDDMCGLLH